MWYTTYESVKKKSQGLYFYQGMIDLNLIGKGAKYNDLIRTVYKKMLRGKTNEEIADGVEESVDKVEQIKMAIIECKRENLLKSLGRRLLWE